MKKLRCTSCGAELKIDDNKEYAVCEHCGSKYKLNEDLNVNIKIDDSVKDVINNGIGAAKHFSMFMLIPIILVILVIAGGVVYGLKSSNDTKKRQEEEQEKNKQEANNMINETIKVVEMGDFNFQFVQSAGTKSSFFLESILDNIVKSNKKYDRKVTLIFNGESTQDENRIVEIKHGLEDEKEYEVSVNYDEDGYVYEIKVDSIN